MTEYEFILQDILNFHNDLAKSKDFIMADGIRDITLIESATATPFQSVFGKDLYPGNIEKAAKLFYGFTKNHGFIDGNKRVAVHSMLTFLKVNNIKLQYDTEELLDLVEDIAKSKADAKKEHERICTWLEKHIV